MSEGNTEISFDEKIRMAAEKALLDADGDHNSCSRSLVVGDCKSTLAYNDANRAWECIGECGMRSGDTELEAVMKWLTDSAHERMMRAMI